MSFCDCMYSWVWPVRGIRGPQLLLFVYMYYCGCYLYRWRRTVRGIRGPQLERHVHRSREEAWAPAAPRRAVGAAWRPSHARHSAGDDDERLIRVIHAILLATMRHQREQDHQTSGAGALLYRSSCPTTTASSSAASVLPPPASPPLMHNSCLF